MQKGKEHYHFAQLNAGFVYSKDRDESVSDKTHSGCPCEVVMSEKIAKVDNLVNNDPHITTTELASISQVGISCERITHIIIV